MQNSARRFAIIGSRGYPSTYGGFETLVRHLAPYLVEAGHHVTVYGRRPEPGTERHDGVEVVHTRGIDRKTASTLTYGLTSAIHASRERCDAALVLNVANGFFLPALRARGVPTAVNVDGLEWERAKWNRLGRSVFRAGARMTASFADALVADSRAIGDFWARRYDVDTHFIPYGAPVLDDAPPRSLHGLGLKPRRYVLVVARLVPENNVDLLLDAMERLRWRYPTVVVGSAVGTSPLQDRLLQLTKTTPNLHWLGHVHDQVVLTELWQQCALYVHGHSVGGTNPALLQALGAGSPTIVFDTPYNREVVGPSWPVYGDSIARLADLISDLFDDASWRRGAIADGRQLISQNYAWESVLDSYASLLCNLAHRSSVRRSS